MALRAAVQGKGISVQRPHVAKGGPDPKAAVTGKQAAYMDGKNVQALVYDRSKLKSGNKIKGPAIVVEMDSTSVILPQHTGSRRQGRLHPHLSGHLQTARGRSQERLRSRSAAPKAKTSAKQKMVAKSKTGAAKRK